MCLQTYYNKPKITDRPLLGYKVITKENGYKTYFLDKPVQLNHTYVNAEWNKLCSYIIKHNVEDTNEFVQDVNVSIGKGAYHSYANPGNALKIIVNKFNIKNRFQARKAAKFMGILMAVIPISSHYFTGSDGDNASCFASEKITYLPFDSSRKKDIINDLAKLTKINKHIIKELLIWNNN